MKNHISKFKFVLIAALFVCLASSHVAQALTMQQIITGQQGRVLGASTPALVQTKVATPLQGCCNSLTTSAAFNSSTTAGNLIIAAAGSTSNSNFPTASISDTAGNSWTLATTTQDSAGTSVTYIWYANNIKGGADTVSTTWTSSGGTEQFDLVVSEYSGIATSNPLDQTTSVFKGSYPVSSFSTGNIITTNTNDLLYSFVVFEPVSGTTVPSVSSNWTLGNSQNSNGLIQMDDSYSITNSTGAYSNTFSGMSAYDGHGFIIGFKAAGSGAGDTTPPSTPSNLFITAVSSSEINFSWTASTDNLGVTGYKIYRGGVQVGTSATNSYSDTGLSASTQYTYTVSAFDAAGNNSSQSVSVSATTQAQSPGGNTITAASCNEGDVQTAISSVSAGGTVVIPAGTCTWTSKLSVTVPITLTGTGMPNSGSGVTGAASSCSSGTSGTLIIDNGGPTNPILEFTPMYGGPAIRVSCMSIDPASTSTALADPIWIIGACASGGCPYLRVDNMTFGLNTYWSEGGNSYNAEAGMSLNNVFGVVDHNTIGSPGNPANNFELLNSQQGEYLGVGQYGDNSWAQPDSLGETNNIFVENNVKYDKGYLAMNDSEQSDNFADRGGDRTVMRYNTLYQGSANNGGYGLFQDHGTDSGGRARGAREAEVYDNTIYCQGVTQNCAGVDGGLRSGTGLFFGNHAIFSNGGVNGPSVSLAEFRNVTASWLPFAACGGDGQWDQNDGIIYYAGTVGSVSNGALTMTDSGKNFPNLVPAGQPYSVYDMTQGWWSEIQSNTPTTITVRPSVGYGPVDFAPGDSYQVLRAAVCIDQPGRGQGKYISGTTPSPTGWVNEVLDPVYRWDETASGGATNGGIVTNGNSRLIPNRDFYDSVSSVQTSPTSPFNGTVGTGYGTLTNRPTTCTPGVGYWATDQGNWNQSGSGGQGELFVCQAGNTWTMYYAPFTYPYPLTSSGLPNPGAGSGGGTVDAAYVPPSNTTPPAPPTGVSVQ